MSQSTERNSGPPPGGWEPGRGTRCADGLGGFWDGQLLSLRAGVVSTHARLMILAHFLCFRGTFGGFVSCTMSIWFEESTVAKPENRVVSG